MAKRMRIEPEAQSIPHDVLFSHVFPRVPAKSLIRFRSVSKLWLSLLLDPQLAKLHRSCSGFRPPPDASIVVSFADRFSLKSLMFFSDLSGTLNPRTPLRTIWYQCVSQVVNGLICLINPDRVSVCNLTTREIISLPVSSSSHRESPLRTHHSCFLFGFDSRAHEYKVVKIDTIVTKVGDNPFGLHRTRNKCEIFTLGTHKWRSIKGSPYKFSSLCKTSRERMLHIQSVCVNDAIHWIQNPETSGKRRLSVFDVRSERFLPGIPFPSHLPRRIKYPIEIGGKLALADCRPQSNHDILSIWVLEDHEKRVWTQSRLLVLTDPNRPQCLPISSSFSDKVYLVRGGLKSPFELLCFDLVDPKNGNKPRRIEIKGLPKNVANISCIQRMSGGGYFCDLGAMDSLAVFITDKLDNMFPLKSFV